MAKKVKKVTKKGKIKKRWFNVLASKIFSEKKIGESPALENTELIGRTAISDLMTLVGDMKRQHVKITFEIYKVDGDNAVTLTKRYNISPAYLKKSIRRSKHKIEDSYKLKTSKGQTMIIKPFIITSGTISSVQSKAVRKKVKEVLVEIVNNKSSEEILNELVSLKLHREVREKVKKLYPLRFFEIKDARLVTIGGVNAEEMDDIAKSVKIEKREPRKPFRPREERTEAPKAEPKVEEKPAEKPKAEEKEVKPEEPKVEVKEQAEQVSKVEESA